MDVAEEEKNKTQNQKPKKTSLEKVATELNTRCQELGIRVIYDDLYGEGGVCRLRDKYLVIINRRASLQTKIRLLEQALRKAGAPTRIEKEIPAPLDTQLSQLHSPQNKPEETG